MVETIKAVTECRVCGSRDWRDVISFGVMPLANSYPQANSDPSEEPRYPLEVVRCGNCLLVCLKHVVHPDVLYRNYIYVSSDTDLVNNHMRWFRDLCVSEHDIGTDGLAVELGSNTGTQLQLFKDAGMRVLGIDPANNIKPVAEANGVPTVADFFTAELAASIAEDSERARIILGRHVFAHIDDLGDVMAGVRNLLDPEGIFVIEVPHLLDLIVKHQFDTIYHEHLSYFSVHTLQALFARHGLRVIDVRRKEVHGGSLIVVACFDSSMRRARNNVSSVLTMEQRFGLTDEATYQDFARQSTQTIDTVRALLAQLATEGKEVVGYGAPAKGNTLLNACHVTTEHMAYCTDTTPAKQGLLLPGTRVPVYSPVRAKANPPDYFFLLAWNYAKEVVDKELGFLAAGGRFIVPIPHVVTISSENLVNRFFADDDTSTWISREGAIVGT